MPTSKEKNNENYILAIDPGYDRLGIAVIDTQNGVGNEKLIFSDSIQTSSEDVFSKRLLKIYNSVKAIISEYRPNVLAIESLFITKNQKTAMKVSETKGVVALAAEESGMDVFEYSPPEIKMAVTGYGSSDKKQVEVMVRKLINFKKDKVLDDELDAVAVGLTHNASHKIRS